MQLRLQVSSTSLPGSRISAAALDLPRAIIVLFHGHRCLRPIQTPSTSTDFFWQVQHWSTKLEPFSTSPVQFTPGVYCTAQHTRKAEQYTSQEHLAPGELNAGLSGITDNGEPLPSHEVIMTYIARNGPFLGLHNHVT